MLRIVEPELMLDSDQVISFAKGKKDYSIEGFISAYKKYVNFESGTIVDLGSGTGEYLVALEKEFPNLKIFGYDGSSSMTNYAKQYVQEQKSFVEVNCLEFKYILQKADCVVSTNTLHHLHDPKVFWEAVKRVSNRCLIMDIVRPDTNEQAELIVEQYANNEPELFKQDFYNSLLAAFSLEELVEQISDTQLKVDMIPGRFNTLKSFIVHGRLA